jgi:hypothetical protein
MPLSFLPLKLFDWGLLALDISGVVFWAIGLLGS